MRSTGEASEDVFAAYKKLITAYIDKNISYNFDEVAVKYIKEFLWKASDIRKSDNSPAIDAQIFQYNIDESYREEIIRISIGLRDWIQERIMKSMIYGPPTEFSAALCEPIWLDAEFALSDFITKFDRLPTEVVTESAQLRYNLPPNRWSEKHDGPSSS